MDDMYKDLYIWSPKIDLQLVGVVVGRDARDHGDG